MLVCVAEPLSGNFKQQIRIRTKVETEARRLIHNGYKVFMECDSNFIGYRYNDGVKDR